MKKLIIPSRYSNVDYDKDVIDDLKNTIDMLKKERRGLYLHGKSGTGKTHLAYAICKEFQKQGMAVRAFKVVDMLKMIREDISHSDNEDFQLNGSKYFIGAVSNYGEISFLEGLLNFKGLLFLDDFGTEKPTEWALETLYTIIDKKYEDIIPMIITSNLGLEELGTLMGDRISSRIIEMCRIYELPGLDRRLTKNIQHGE